MINLNGQPGELRFTVQIIRKETGKVEEIELVGKITDEQLQELSDGSHTQHSSPRRGD